MKKETTQTAATIEEAVQQAAAELGVPAVALQTEVVQQPQKKTLGLFGGQPAVVRAWVETTDASGEGEAAEAAPVDFTEAGESARAYLADILAGMGAADADISVETTDTGVILRLDGEHLGFVIGRRGDTLDALQYLTSLVANRRHEGFCRVTIDIGNYRERRKESLSGMATRHAEQAARTGRKFSLEAMNPYERRIVHTAVQAVEGATSWSVGKEPNRYVVIGPSDDNPVKAHPQGGRGGNRRGRGNGGRRGGERSRERDPYNSSYLPSSGKNRPVREFVSRQNPLPTADGATPPEKTVSSVENSDIKLYGRIDL